MTRTIHRILCAAALALALAGPAAAGPSEVGAEDLRLIDDLYAQAARENWHAEGIALMRESLERCERLLEAEPTSYELLWRSARSAIGVGETAKTLQVKDWRAQCSAMARKGLEWTEAAKRAAKDRVEGYFWQLQAIGILKDAEGVGGVIAVGAVAKSKQDLDAAYSIDRAYLDYSPVIAMSLYYFNLPPIFGQDLSKAVTYYKEYASLAQTLLDSYRQCIDLAEMLMSTGSAEYKERARELLSAALADPTPRPFYSERAKVLMEKLERSLR